MAAYTKTVGFSRNCEQKLIGINNTIDRKVLLDIVDLIDDELDAIVTKQSTYTLQVTSLQAQKKLVNLSNTFRQDLMMILIDDLYTELGLIVTNGTSYTKTVYQKYESGVTDFIDGIIPKLKRHVQGLPSIRVKIALEAIIDLIDTELDAIETADADT